MVPDVYTVTGAVVAWRILRRVGVATAASTTEARPGALSVISDPSGVGYGLAETVDAFEVMARFQRADA